MKVLFLDVDGVLNNEKTFKKGERYPLDPYCIDLIWKIRKETGCEIVLSSTWRHSTEALKEVEKHIGFIRDITGRCSNRIRGCEINAWLQDNLPWDERKDGGSFRYAILDDDSDMLLWQKDHFFQTNGYKDGLTEEIADKVIAHLNS